MEFKGKKTSHQVLQTDESDWRMYDMIPPDKAIYEDSDLIPVKDLP